jgi:hypothetical protein
MLADAATLPAMTALDEAREQILFSQREQRQQQQVENLLLRARLRLSRPFNRFLWCVPSSFHLHHLLR